MIETLFILALVTWTFFGFVVLFNVPIEDLKPSLRLALAVGPMITIGFAMIVVGLAIVEKVVGWVKNA